MNEKIEQIKKNFSDKFPKQKKITIIVILGLVGIMLIFLSEMFNVKPASSKMKSGIKMNTEGYKQQIESELTEILGQISGVGKVRVMITLEGTTENIYAEEYDTKSDSQDGKTSDSYKNSYVVVENDNDKEALIKKVIKPQINGVIVVCEGGDNLVVSEKVYKAVSTVLAISSSRVCVVKG